MSHSSPTRLIGFSPTPTLYRIVLPERGDVYLKCGADILINGLKTNLEAEARCPVCGTIIRFSVTDGQVGGSAAKGAILHVVEFEISPRHLAIKSNATHIFDKRECLNKWQSTYAGKPSRIMTFPEYMS